MKAAVTFIMAAVFERYRNYAVVKEWMVIILEINVTMQRFPPKIRTADGKTFKNGKSRNMVRYILSLNDIIAELSLTSGTNVRRMARQ